METVKLNFKKYVPGRSVRENVIACLPGELEPIKVKGRNEEFLLDRKNSRLYVINTQTCSPKDKEAWLPQSTEYDGKDRKRLYTRKVLPEGMNIVDYDAYVIAAGEYDGDDLWYNTWELGGDYLNVILTDSFKAGENRTFHYSVLAMFDRQEYLKDYSEHNILGKDQMGDLSIMEKYIYQRTHIDVDVHDENLLVYQDEIALEHLLASINWFHDGQPTGITDDEDFLRRWDALDDGFKSSHSEKTVDRIRKNMTVYGVDVKVIIDKSRKELSEPDTAKDYIEYERGKFLRLFFTARFGGAYDGPLTFELSHDRSGFISKWGMHRPEKKYCDGNLLSIGTTEFSLEQVLGKGYRIPDDCKDFITVKMFNESREVFRKDFQIRRIGA